MNDMPFALSATSASGSAPRTRDKQCSCTETRASRRSWGDAMRSASKRRQDDALFRKHMPAQLEELWEAVKDAEAMELIVRLLGGVTVRVPAQMPHTGSSELLRLLGRRITARLVAHFGGTPLYVPHCRSFFTKLKHMKIIQEYSRHLANGSSTCLAEQRLAMKYGLCDRWIRMLVNRAENGDLPLMD